MTDAAQGRPGATPLPGGGVRFRVWAPLAARLAVLRAGGSAELELEGSGSGVFEGVVEEAAAGWDYTFRLDGERELPDPASRYQPGGVDGPSRVVDASAFDWTDSGWRGVAREDLVIYELHVGTFTRGGTFDAVGDRLAALRDLGVTAVELMPVAQFSGERNWGYDGVFPYAPQNSYGGPEGLRRLVDAAHRTGLAVLLDVVYNHLGPEGNALPHFGPYFTDRYATPWGSAVNFDGPESDEVRRYFLGNALHWIEDYHLDGLRLDAVHAIFDASAQPFLGELARALHAAGERAGRPVHVIAESDANDPRLVRDAGRGGLGLDAVWSDDFHHAVHAELTGERSGYYADYGGADRIAKAYADRFVYDGIASPSRRRRHGAPARDVPSDRFVVCVQNHDQIGNRGLGERLSALLPPGDQRLAAALLLLSPYVPLLFMGEEYGETSPFLYFVSHRDPELREAVRRGRRREFEGFDWRDEVPDPASREAFERSRLRPDLAGHDGHAGTLALYRALLALRREEPLLRPGRARLEVSHEAGAGSLRVAYRSHGGDGRPPAFAVFHCGSGATRAEAPAGAPAWERRLASDDAAFGGPGARAPARLEGARAGFSPAPRTAVFYAGVTG